MPQVSQEIKEEENICFPFTTPDFTKQKFCFVMLGVGEQIRLKSLATLKESKKKKMYVFPSLPLTLRSKRFAS